MPTGLDNICLLAHNVKLLCEEKGISLENLTLEKEDNIKLETIFQGIDQPVDLRFVERIAEALDVHLYMLYLPVS